MVTLEIDSPKRSFLEEEFPDETSVNLVKKIMKRVVDEKAFDTPLTKTLKGVFFIASFLGRIPFFPQMEKLASGNAVLAVFFKVMSLPVYATDYIWSSKRMIDEQVFAIEFRRLDQQGNLRIDPALFLSVLMGACAQMPLVCLAYHYNQQSPQVVAFSSLDAIFPMYSSRGLIRSLMRGQKVPHPIFLEYTKKVSALKDKLLNDELPSLNFLQDASLAKDEKADLLLEALDDLEDEYVALEPRAVAKEVYVKLSGSLLTLVYLAWLGVFTFDGAKTIYDQPVLDGFFTLVAVIANAFLIGSLFIDTQRMFVQAFEDRMAYKKRYTTLSEALFPNVAFVLKVSSVVFITFQSMAAIQISQEYLPESFQIPNSVFLSLAYIVPAYVPTRQITDWLIQALVAKWGSVENQKKLKIFQTLENIEGLLQAGA